MLEIGPDDVRRLNWFGVKPGVAKLLAWRPANAVVQLVARTVLPVKLARRLPLARNRVHYRLANGQDVSLLDPINDRVARDIYWGGSQPTRIPDRRKLKCVELLSEGAEVFLDVGAYAGLYALIAARSNPRLRAVTYEIVPQNYLHTVRNILENDLADRIEARLCGIGAEPDTIRLPVSMGGTSFMSSISLGSRFGSGISVPVRTLDSETEDLEGPVVMKVDVEGYEEQVFLGGQQFLKRSRPDVICEILPDAEAACDSIDSMLRPLGYRTFAFEESGVVEHPKVVPQPVLRDWLFTTREDIDALLAKA